MACFLCAQLRTTVSGYPRIDLTQAVQCEQRCNIEIDTRGDGAFAILEMENPGTLVEQLQL